MSAATADTTARPHWPHRRVLVILLLISLLLNVCFIAGAAWIKLQPPARWPGMAERYQEMAAQLDLDAKQRSEFDAYVAAMRGRTTKMQQQVTPLMNAAWEEIAKPQADSAQVMQLFDQAAEKRREFQREATTQTLAFLAVLSPAQRAKYVALERERRASWQRNRPAQR